jgi:hypothetical protein
MHGRLQPRSRCSRWSLSDISSSNHFLPLIQRLLGSGSPRCRSFTLKCGEVELILKLFSKVNREKWTSGNQHSVSFSGESGSCAVRLIHLGILRLHMRRTFGIWEVGKAARAWGLGVVYTCCLGWRRWHIHVTGWRSWLAGGRSIYSGMEGESYSWI